ncbi:MAG: SDR family NAD(P)-dependent oxidoreductase [Alcanivorax sp.]|nr:SDR family NAD(P)-dependent oxidoreductase [Alcanivorax sp.]
MGKVRLITGASGGIGGALTRRCLEAGDTVFAVSRRPVSGEARAAYEEQRLIPVAADLTREADIAALMERVAGAGEALDSLIHCAGVLHDEAHGLAPEKRLEDLDGAALAHAFALNASAPMLLAKHGLPLLRRRQRAVFASLSARVGSIADNRLGGWYAYRASKAAQNQFIRTFAVEARRRVPGLVVLALHPGTVDTALSRPFQRNVPEGKLFTPDFAAERLLGLIDGAGEADSGRFLAWDGKDIPW